MNLRKLGKSKAKASLARISNVQVTIEGDYENDRQRFQSVSQHLGVVYSGNSVVSSDIDDRVDELEFVPVSTKTTNYSCNVDDRILLVDATSGDVEITLPNPSLSYVNGGSIPISINKIDNSANIVSILPFASETILGDSSVVLEYQNEVIGLITNGTSWWLKD